jgi:hypothetical protein
VVEVELTGGALLPLESISHEPGYGFVTLALDPPDDEAEREALIVPVGSIARIVISSAPDPRGRLGFSLPGET